MRKAVTSTLNTSKPGNHTSQRERDDKYFWVLAHVGSFHRVIIDKDALQFILQRRYYETFPTVAWRALCYPTSKKSLIRLCVKHTPFTEPKIYDALQKVFETASAYRRIVQTCRQQSD